MGRAAPPSSPTSSHDLRRHTRTRPPPPPLRDEAQAPADAARVAAAPAVAGRRRARRDVPPGKDRLPELHRPGVPRPDADEVGWPEELHGPDPRHHLPRLDLDDG